MLPINMFNNNNMTARVTFRKRTSEGNSVKVKVTLEQARKVQRGRSNLSSALNGGETTPLLTQCFSGDKIEKNKMSGAFSS
jgi:hypothetical protein